MYYDGTDDCEPKDMELRRKLFGNRNGNCLNVTKKGCDENGETGFIGQTIRIIETLKEEVAIGRASREIIYHKIAEVQQRVTKLEDKIKKNKKK